MMGRTWILASALASFLAGAGSGILADRGYRVSCDSSHGMSTGHHGERMIEYLRTRLALTDEQVEQIGLILRDSGKEMDELAKEFRPRFAAVHHAASDKIRSTLTAEQGREFERILEECARAKSAKGTH